MEIYQHITSLLEPSDLICLGLACTALWSLTRKNDLQALRSRSPYYLHQRRKLLQDLARDSFDLIACNLCVKLQPLRAGLALTMSNNWLRPPCPHLACYIKICQHFSVTREMLELVLKFQKHQKSAGLKHMATPDSFSHTCNWRTSGNSDLESSLSVASKVVDGGLYLKLTYDIDIKHEVGGSFNTPCMAKKGCLHSGMWLKKRCFCALRHAAKGEGPCAGCSRAQRCAYCFTDFLVSTKRKSASRLQLKVSAYRYLGRSQDGNALSDHAWLAQSQPLSMASRRKFDVHSTDFPLREIFEDGTGKGIATTPLLEDHQSTLSLGNESAVHVRDYQSALFCGNESARPPGHHEWNVDKPFKARAALFDMFWRPSPWQPR